MGRVRPVHPGVAVLERVGALQAQSAAARSTVRHDITELEQERMPWSVSRLPIRFSNTQSLQ